MNIVTIALGVAAGIFIAWFVRSRWRVFSETGNLSLGVTLGEIITLFIVGVFVWIGVMKAWRYLNSTP